jgi:hypothetical protein
MHYNIQDVNNPLVTFARKFTLPLWQYVVPPRTPEDQPYIVDLDFAVDPLAQFIAVYQPVDKDVLEVFELRRRVLITGLRVEVEEPAAGLVIRPVTNSGMVFDPIDCTLRSDKTYVLNGGTLDRSTDLIKNSVLIDDPDYLGFRIESGVGELDALRMRVELVANDTFPWWATTNYAHDESMQ